MSWPAPAWVRQNVLSPSDGIHPFARTSFLGRPRLRIPRDILSTPLHKVLAYRGARPDLQDDRSTLRDVLAYLNGATSRGRTTHLW